MFISMTFVSEGIVLEAVEVLHINPKNIRYLDSKTGNRMITVPGSLPFGLYFEDHHMYPSPYETPLV